MGIGCCNSQQVARNKVCFVLGGPFSGKTTQCQKIMKDYEVEYLSPEIILKNVVDKKKVHDWKDLQKKIEFGVYLSSKELLTFFREEFKDIDKTILLEGFPLNKEQVEDWNIIMNDLCEVIAVLYLECPTDEMKKRKMEHEEVKIDINNDDMVLKKINDFHQNCSSILNQFKLQNKLIVINAAQNIEETFLEIKNKINESKTLVIKLNQKENNINKKFSAEEFQTIIEKLDNEFNTLEIFSKEEIQQVIKECNGNYDLIVQKLFE